MANYHINTLPTQEVSINQMGENLRILLNDIFFLRDFNCTKPIDVYSEMYNTNYVCGNNKYVILAIEDSIDAFRSTVLKRKKSDGTVIVGFYKYITKTSLFGLKKTREKIYWEKWILPYIIFDGKKTKNIIHNKQKENLIRVRFSIQQQAINNADIVPDTIVNIDTLSDDTKYNKPDRDTLVINAPGKPSHDFNISFTFAGNEPFIDVEVIKSMLIGSPKLTT
jgi:hypothetical protein